MSETAQPDLFQKVMQGLGYLISSLLGGGATHIIAKRRESDHGLRIAKLEKAMDEQKREVGSELEKIRQAQENQRNSQISQHEENRGNWRESRLEMDNGFEAIGTKMDGILAKMGEIHTNLIEKLGQKIGRDERWPPR